MNRAPRKRFGQNFLVDRGAIDDILGAVSPSANDLIFEIGPGREALTRPLAASGATVVAVEIDRDLAAELLAGNPPFEVLNEDALRVDFAALAASRPYRLVGNLPYNVSTPLLFHVLAQEPPPRDMHFMLQKEVAQRLAAGPGSKRYGRLSLTCQNLCEVIPLFELGPEAFEPRPKVDSALVRLIPRPEPLSGTGLLAAFEQVVAQAFSQRRKTLRNSLRTLLEASLVEAADVDPSRRPEQLDIGAFIRLAAELRERAVG